MSYPMILVLCALAGLAVGSVLGPLLKMAFPRFSFDSVGRWVQRHPRVAKVMDAPDVIPDGIWWSVAVWAVTATVAVGWAMTTGATASAFRVATVILGALSLWRLIWNTFMASI